MSEYVECHFLFFSFLYLPVLQTGVPSPIFYITFVYFCSQFKIRLENLNERHFCSVKLLSLLFPTFHVTVQWMKWMEYMCGCVWMDGCMMWLKMLSAKFVHIAVLRLWCKWKTSAWSTKFITSTSHCVQHQFKHVSTTFLFFIMCCWIF